MLINLVALHSALPFASRQRSSGAKAGASFERTFNDEQLSNVLKQVEKVYGCKIIFSYEDISQLKSEPQGKCQQSGSNNEAKCVTTCQ